MLDEEEVDRVLRMAHVTTGELDNVKSRLAWGAKKKVRYFLTRQRLRRAYRIVNSSARSIQMVMEANPTTSLEKEDVIAISALACRVVPAGAALDKGPVAAFLSLMEMLTVATPDGNRAFAFPADSNTAHEIAKVLGIPMERIGTAEQIKEQMRKDSREVPPGRYL